MKLKINRREEQKGLIFKKPMYYIDVSIELSPSEAALIKKHKWQDHLMAKIENGDQVLRWKTGEMVGTHTYPFKLIEWAADFEKQVIENARILKSNLETSAGFVAGGPREVEL